MIPGMTYGMEEARRDMAERWLPSETAKRHALALLAAEPRAYCAVVPMYQPGKDHGVWVRGQEVCTVPGVVFLAVNSFKDEGDIPSLSWARDAAERLARGILGDAFLPGTTAYACIYPDGHVAVFEGF